MSKNLALCGAPELSSLSAELFGNQRHLSGRFELSKLGLRTHDIPRTSFGTNPSRFQVDQSGIKGRGRNFSEIKIKFE